MYSVSTFFYYYWRTVHVISDPFPLDCCTCSAAVPNSPCCAHRHGQWMQQCPLASNPALSQGGIHLVILTEFLPTEPPQWSKRFGTKVPVHSHHQSASGQIAVVVRQMSDDWVCYLSAWMTMGLCTKIERQKALVVPHTGVTQRTSWSMLSAIQLAVSQHVKVYNTTNPVL